MPISIVVASIAYLIFFLIAVREAYIVWFKPDEFLAKQRKINSKASLWIARVLSLLVALILAFYLFSFILALLGG